MILNIFIMPHPDFPTAAEKQVSENGGHPAPLTSYSEKVSSTMEWRRWEVMSLGLFRQQFSEVGLQDGFI